MLPVRNRRLGKAVPVTLLSFTLPPAAPSAAQAREQLRNVMGAWADEDTRDDAQLLLTEVVANGVIHARSTMGIQLTVEHNLLRAEVSDDCPQTPILRQPHDAGGRGLLILSRLASRWGVLRHPGDGKTVWFELADATHLAAPSWWARTSSGKAVRPAIRETKPRCH